MKTYFVISDVHSFYDEMMKALLKEGFDESNDEHIIISCGDNFDRGDKSKEVLDFLYNLMKKDRAILIRGNHEDLFKDMVARGYPLGHDRSNGTVKTLIQLNYDPAIPYSIAVNSYDSRLDELFANMVDYYETDNFVFLHGWFPGDGESFREATKQDWKNARWLNGIQEAMVFGNKVPNKTVVCGHWNSSYGNIVFDEKYKQLYKDKDITSPYDDEIFELTEQNPEELTQPFYGDGVIDIDAMTALSHRCNCLKITEDEL